MSEKNNYLDQDSQVERFFFFKWYLVISGDIIFIVLF